MLYNCFQGDGRVKQVIYIDVLIFLNTVVTFLLLLSASKLLKIFPSGGRLVFGSMLGGASSLIIFAPELGSLLSLLVKFLFSVIITSVTYNPKSFGKLLRCVGYFFCVSFIFAGMMLFAASIPSLSILTYKNGAVYVDFSLISLITASVVCYLITAVLNKITKHSNEWDILVSVRVFAGGKNVQGSAIVDTGNSLTDPFSGESIIIADKFCLHDVIPEDVIHYLNGENDKCGQLRLLPCSTVTSDGLMPVFRAEKVVVKCDGRVKFIEKPLIAVSGKKLPHIILPRDAAVTTERRKEREKVVF